MSPQGSLDKVGRLQRDTHSLKYDGSLVWQICERALEKKGMINAAIAKPTPTTTIPEIRVKMNQNT